MERITAAEARFMCEGPATRRAMLSRAYNAIRTCVETGSDSWVFPVRPHERRYKEYLIKELTDDGYAVEWDDKAAVLVIRWRDSRPDPDPAPAQAPDPAPAPEGVLDAAMARVITHRAGIEAQTYRAIMGAISRGHSGVHVDIGFNAWDELDQVSHILGSQGYKVATDGKTYLHITW